MDIWFIEKQTEDLTLGCRITSTLVRERTPYQDLAIVDSVQWGRILVLDGCVMTTEEDEFVYHEMISHVPLLSHPDPRRVLIIGGGDGGALREVLRHRSVEKATLVEIDARVIEQSKRFLPSIATSMDDPRAEVLIGDGVEHVRRARDCYDVILCDSTDPIGPAVGLFSAEFYRDCHAALREGGIFVAQSESPFLNAELIRDVQRRLASVFPCVRLYLATVPTYPGGLWSFSLGSKGPDPLQPRPCDFPTRYYDSEVHRAAFVLPPFVRELAATPAP